MIPVSRRAARVLAAAAFTAALASLAGCITPQGEGPAFGPQVSYDPLHGAAQPPKGVASERCPVPRSPSGLTSVDFQGQQLTLWPFADRTFDGAGEDPVNLVFAGQADPRQIRAALLALDGNRTAYGFPDVYPFNARWTDSNGDAMLAFAGLEGWAGGVIQLQLGNYAPVRAHLRLFRTGSLFAPAGGPRGTWAVGSAHFEVMIPGTADHQVLSWELAEQLVTVDLMRTGLLHPTAPVGQTGQINPAPGYRAIPDVIYNQLPPELIAAIGGPPQPAPGPVPIATDGRATILHLSAAAPVTPDQRSEDLTFTYSQVVPKPICNPSGASFVLVEGPVDFHKRAWVDERGTYRFKSGYSGKLRITPLDITTNPPSPAGAPYEATVGESQEGQLDARGGSLHADTRRMAPQAGGTEFLIQVMKVATHGPKAVRSVTRCNP